MKNRKLLIFTIFWATFAFAQDIHFTHVNQAGQFINPAMLGAFNGDHRAIFNYKSQWASVMNPYKTIAVQYDGRYSGKKWNSDALTFGFSVFSDKAGEVSMKTQNVNFGLGYIKTLNTKNSISAGLQLGWGSKGIDQNNAQWDNQYDPSASNGYNANLSTGESTFYGTDFSFLDMNFGLLWNYQPFRNMKIVTGASIFHIAPVTLKYEFGDTEVLDRRWNAHVMLIKKLEGSNITLMPSVLFMKQGILRETLVGFKARYAVNDDSRYSSSMQDMYFEAGGQYRIGDAFIMSVGYAWRNFQFRISYTFNTSALALATHGNAGGEISLVYTTPFKRKKKGNTMY